MSLTAGQGYALAVRVCNHEGSSDLNLQWKTPGSDAFVDVPFDYFGRYT